MVEPLNLVAKYKDGFRGRLGKRNQGIFTKWENRFFVLEGKTIRYYTDESCASLKGEYTMVESSKITLPKEPVSVLKGV